LEFQKLTIADVAEFYRAPPGAGRKHPDGCWVLLEDMKGGCRRDDLGRPIIVCLGMQHGSAKEMQRQCGYIAELAQQHMLPSSPKGLCIVIETRPRDAGAPQTFRFPDRDMRAVFAMNEEVYGLEDPRNITHVCGLPRSWLWAFRLLKPFMSREALESMVLKPNFAHLAGAMPQEHLLSQWGGELDFDIDAWVEWRAKQEGIPKGALCARGCGRSFDQSAAATAAAEADVASGISAHGLISGSISGQLSVSGRPPRLHGPVEKRGSGIGIFSTIRWKPKLLAVSEVGLVYFDLLEVTDDNKAACVISLAEVGTSVEHRRPSGEEAGMARFALVTPVREYLFRVPTEAQAAGWVTAIQVEIDAAQNKDGEDD